MSNNSSVRIAIASAMVGAVTLVGGGIFLLGGSDPQSVSLEQAVAAASSAAGATGAGSTGGSAASDLVGEWRVVADGASFVGYRVEEELAGVGATTAVGRTTAVSGDLSYDGSAITAVEVTADVSQLTSDQSRRDMALRQQALQTATYPEASFRLTSPIAVDGSPAPGTSVSARATGILTMHGVSKEVTVPLQGQLTGERLVVVGSTEIAFADFNIAQPRAGAVISVADRATLEMQLVFARDA